MTLTSVGQRVSADSALTVTAAGGLVLGLPAGVRARPASREGGTEGTDRSGSKTDKSRAAAADSRTRSGSWVGKRR